MIGPFNGYEASSVSRAEIGKYKILITFRKFYII